MSRRAPILLLALAALLGPPLHPVAPALADPARAAALGTAPLEATLDELEARVRQLSQGPAAAEALTLRQELTAARARIAELEAARAEDAAALAALRAELEGSRAEAGALGERLEASRRGLERLNAVLAAATAGRGSAESRVAATTATGR